MINVYGVETPDKLIVEYYKDLLKRCFALLPVYEGRSITTKMIEFTTDKSYKMFQSYLQNLIIEICGSNALFLVNEKSIKLLSILRGLQEVNINEQKKIKSAVFSCTDLCTKIINQLIAECQNNIVNKECDNNNGL